VSCLNATPELATSYGRRSQNGVYIARVRGERAGARDRTPEKPRGRAAQGRKSKEGLRDPTRLPYIVYSTKIGVASRLSKKWQMPYAKSQNENR